MRRLFRIEMALRRLYWRLRPFKRPTYATAGPLTKYMLSHYVTPNIDFDADSVKVMFVVDEKGVDRLSEER